MFQIDFQKPMSIYFVGIGGISMSGIAAVLLGHLIAGGVACLILLCLLGAGLVIIVFRHYAHLLKFLVTKLLFQILGIIYKQALVL